MRILVPSASSLVDGSLRSMTMPAAAAVACRWAMAVAEGVPLRPVILDVSLAKPLAGLGWPSGKLPAIRSACLSSRGVMVRFRMVRLAAIVVVVVVVLFFPLLFLLLPEALSSMVVAAVVGCELAAPIASESLRLELTTHLEVGGTWGVTSTAFLKPELNVACKVPKVSSDYYLPYCWREKLPFRVNNRWCVHVE